MTQGCKNSTHGPHYETTPLREGTAYGTYGRLCTRQYVRAGRQFTMGGIATGRMSGAAYLLRYGIGSPGRPAGSGGLLTGVSARRYAGGLAVRSSGALDGPSRDINRGITATAGGVSLAGRRSHRYHDG